MYKLIIFYFFLITACNVQPVSYPPSYTIPFDYQQDFIIIEVKINGIPFDFLFDTGSQYTILLKPFLGDLLGLEVDRSIEIYGSDLDSGIVAYVSRGVNLKTGNIPTKKQDILILEKELTLLDNLTGRQIAGILGTRFFYTYVVELDYRSQKLHFYLPNETPPVQSFIPIEGEVEDHKLFIPARLISRDQTRLKVNLMIDSGADLPLLLHANTDSSINIPEDAIPGIIGAGLGGEITGYFSDQQGIYIDSFYFDQVLTAYQELDLTTLSSARTRRNGLIGNSLLSRFHLILDFHNALLYIKPEKHTQDEFVYDHSGMMVIASGLFLEDYVVNSVIRNSPAYKAGIREGDKLIKLQGWPMAFHSLGSIRRILSRPPGKTVTVVLRRNGEKIKKKITLADYL